LQVAVNDYITLLNVISKLRRMGLPPANAGMLKDLVVRKNRLVVGFASQFSKTRDIDTLVKQLLGVCKSELTVVDGELLVEGQEEEHAEYSDDFEEPEPEEEEEEYSEDSEHPEDSSEGGARDSDPDVDEVLAEVRREKQELREKMESVQAQLALLRQSKSRLLAQHNADLGTSADPDTVARAAAMFEAE
jgi:hypothetical protein